MNVWAWAWIAVTVVGLAGHWRVEGGKLDRISEAEYRADALGDE